MTKSYITIGLIVGVTIAGVALTGCAQDGTDSSTKPKQQKVVLKEKPLTKFDSQSNKTYLEVGSYVGKPVASLKKVNWKKEDSSYSFTFLPNNKAAVGKYTDGKLSYSRILSYTTKKDNYYQFKQVALITNQNSYKRLSKKAKSTYTKTNVANVPGAQAGVQYYRSTRVGISKKPVQYRFYQSGKNLIRENNAKGNNRYYFKYAQK